MALFISKGHLFKPESENHYKLHNRIDSTQYPQYHDFYEIVLVTSGILKLTLCGQKFSLQQGSLVFIRPNDIHSKSGKNCSHINLAFPIETIDALFLYLCDINCKNNMESALYIPPCLLSQEDYQSLLERINKLNSIESNDWRQTRTCKLQYIFAQKVENIFVQSSALHFSFLSFQKGSFIL